MILLMRNKIAAALVLVWEMAMRTFSLRFILFREMYVFSFVIERVQNGGWVAGLKRALLKEPYKKGGGARGDHRAIKSEPRRGSVGVRWFGVAHY